MVAEHAVAVEINFRAVRGLKEAEILFCDQLRDLADIRCLVMFDVAALAADVVLQLPPGRVEGVTDGDVGVFMRMIGLGIAGDHDLPPGYPQHETNTEQIALMVAPVPFLDHDPAGGDPRMELFQLGDARADPVCKCF